MKLRHALAFLLLFFCRQAVAAEVDVRFEAANAAYRASNYDKAAKLYEEVLTQGEENAEVYYNLGNCYYKLNRIPAAILQYERARRLDPSDEDIAHNLALANLHVVDRVEPIPDLFFMTWWHAWTDMAAADRWAVWAIGFLWGALILCMALFLPYPSFLLRRIFSLLALACFGLFLLSIAAALDRHSRAVNHRYGVVFAASTDVHSAPGAQSTGLFLLHEGVKVELLDRVGDWNKIRLADGKIGWIPSSTFQVI